MALNLVTFEDKQNLNTKPEIARINKVTDDDINQLKNAINNLIYPIGSIIYNADSSFDPNTVYGGTWEKIKGKMIIGYDENDDDFSTLKATGGSKTHTQTVDELASHTHHLTAGAVSQVNGGAISGLGGGTLWSAGIDLNTAMNTAGNSQPMDIMNPYYVANIWLRIS